MLVLCGAPDTPWSMLRAPQEPPDRQVPTFPWGDTRCGPEGGSSESFTALIIMKGDKEMCKGQGGRDKTERWVSKEAEERRRGAHKEPDILD